MPSSIIKRFEYLASEERLVVELTTGRTYSYLGVPGDLAQQMRLAFAKGEFFNRKIRGRFDYRREP